MVAVKRYYGNCVRYYDCGMLCEGVCITTHHTGTLCPATPNISRISGTCIVYVNQLFRLAHTTSVCLIRLHRLCGKTSLPIVASCLPCPLSPTGSWVPTFLRRATIITRGSPGPELYWSELQISSWWWFWCIFPLLFDLSIVFQLHMRLVNVPCSK